MEQLTDLFTVTNLLFVLILLLICYILYPLVDPTLSHIPGPNPVPLFGNLLPYIKHGFGEADKMYMKKYGNIFRMYQGRQPCIVVNDEEIIKHVTIKEFNTFSNHTRIPFRGIWRQSLVDAVDDDWRRLRVMLTPIFTTGKLKKMFPLVKKCAERFVQIVANCNENKDFEAKRYCGMFTLDVIARTEFSVDLEQHDPNNPFIQNALDLTNSFSAANFTFLIAMFFPFLVKPMEWYGVLLLSKKHHDFFQNLLTKLIKERSGSGNADINDMLQPMLDAHKQEHDQETKAQIQDSGLDNVKNTSKAFSETEVLANALIFFLAGYDTTSSTLAWMLYELSKHEDIQEKILEEMHTVLGDNKEIDYEAISKMQYLDQCVQETLRMYPPLTRTERYCDKEITIKGVRIPANTTVVLPLYLLHYNPDVWPEPNEYRPERFHPDEKKNRSPIFHMPFGLGPRHCIGMRLALMELKLAVALLVQEYQFIPAKQETKMKFDFNTKPLDGIWVAVKKRH